jgi:hypothetical protein
VLQTVFCTPHCQSSLHTPQSAMHTCSITIYTVCPTIRMTSNHKLPVVRSKHSMVTARITTLQKSSLATYQFQSFTCLNSYNASTLACETYSGARCLAQCSGGTFMASAWPGISPVPGRRCPRRQRLPLQLMPAGEAIGQPLPLPLPGEAPPFPRPGPHQRGRQAHRSIMHSWRALRYIAKQRAISSTTSLQASLP